MNTYHHFHIDKDNPDVIFCKMFSDNTNIIKAVILKDGVTVADIKNPTGNFKPLETFIIKPDDYSLSNESKTYLDKNIVQVYLPNESVEYQQKFYQHGGK